MLDASHSHVLVLLSAAIAVAAGAVSDLRHYKIPNGCSLLLLVLYPVHVWVAPYAVDVTGGLIVAVAVFAATFSVYAMGRLGGGDVKLLSALALWAGPELGAALIVVTSLSGAGLALLMLSRVRFALAMLIERTGDREALNNVLAERLPYGIAIACGGAAVLAALGR